MKIKNFKVDDWLNTREHLAQYNLSSSCCKPVTFRELLELAGIGTEDFFKELIDSPLDYGNPLGSPRLKKSVTGLYTEIVTEDMVICTHGGTGANAIVYQALIEKGDNVVCILPNYQLNYSLPEALGAEIRIFTCDENSNYTVDLKKIKSMIDENTKLITLANPNNPTGYALSKNELEQLAKMAREVQAYIVCDEIYRGLDETYMYSICDLYEKGICTSSVSKVFSIPGSRVGWIVTRDLRLKETLMKFRSYNSLCEGPINEWIASIVLENKEVFYRRNRRIADEGRAILYQWLKEQPHFKAACDSKSAIALIYYDFDIPAEKLANELFEKKGVLVCHGGCFEQEHCFRVGYGMGDTEKLQQSFALIADYVEELDEQGRIKEIVE